MSILEYKWYQYCCNAYLRQYVEIKSNKLKVFLKMSCIYTLKRKIEVHLELCEWINCWNVFEEMTQSIYLNEF